MKEAEISPPPKIEGSSTASSPPQLARNLAQITKKSFLGGLKSASALHSSTGDTQALITESPPGFCNLFVLSANHAAQDTLNSLSENVQQLLASRSAAQPIPLNVCDPTLPHSRIYAGYDYSERGPVIVHPDHLPRIFPEFIRPTQEEIAARTTIGKENFGTMPGIESAYSGAIVKALKPRTVFVIGEHKGHLTKYLAECAPRDTLFFTMDLPASLTTKNGLPELDPINRSYITYEESQIGEAWRDSDLASRIIGLAGDSTSDTSRSLYSSLAGKIDLVVVDGNHEYSYVCSDLISANRLLSANGVIIVDDFWKPARLYEVTEACLFVRRQEPSIKNLYHLSWGVGDDQVASNLAFFIKSQQSS